MSLFLLLSKEKRLASCLYNRGCGEICTGKAVLPGTAVTNG